LELWLKKSTTVSVVYPVLSILLIGSVLNALYHVGYYNWLAHDKSNMILLVNFLSFIVCIVTMPIFIHFNGTIGATFGFVAMNLIGLIISLEWLKKSK